MQTIACQASAVAAETASRLMKAISHRSRLMIILLLSTGEFSVAQLHMAVGQSKSSLSQHLAILRRENLVKTRKEAQTVYYSLQPAKADRLVNCLRVICRPSPFPLGPFQR